MHEESGRFIPHDDDFDIALLFNTDDCEEMLSRVFAVIKELLPIQQDMTSTNDNLIHTKN